MTLAFSLHLIRITTMSVHGNPVLMASVKLDHTAYPYIIDLILHHCDGPTQAAFSATAKVYRARLAKLLLHVNMVYEDRGVRFDYPRAITPRDTDPLQLPTVPALVLALDIDDTVPVNQGLSGGQASDPPCLSYMATCFDPLRVVRRMGSAVVRPHHCIRCQLGTIPKAETLVDYIDVEDSQSWTSVVPRGRIELASASQTYILHLRWDASKPPPDSFFAIRFSDWAHLNEVALVLHPFSSVGNLSGSMESAALLVSGVFLALLESYKRSDQPPKFEIVGLEQTDIQSISMKSPSGDHFCNLVGTYVFREPHFNAASVPLPRPSKIGMKFRSLKRWQRKPV